MSPVVPPSIPSFLPFSHQRCRFALHHHQDRLTKIPSISKIRRFPTSPPPLRSHFCRSRLKSPQPPCFFTRSRFSYTHNSPIIIFSPCPVIGAPRKSLISLPFTGFGSLDHGLSFKILLLFSQESYKLLTCYNKIMLCIPCWLGWWLVCRSVYVFFYLYSCLLSFAFQVVLPVMVWIWFCWLIFSWPVCSIDLEEEKGIVILDRNWCYPLDFWFFGKFEMSCFDLTWRFDRWLVVWSRLLLPEDLALFFNPDHLMARDPEVLVSKASPCVTSVTLFVYPMYQSLFMMSQFTVGVVSSSLGLVLDILYYGFSPDFTFNEN